YSQCLQHSRCLPSRPPPTLRATRLAATRARPTPLLRSTRARRRRRALRKLRLRAALRLAATPRPSNVEFSDYFAYPERPLGARGSYFSPLRGRRNSIETITSPTPATRSATLP